MEAIGSSSSQSDKVDLVGEDGGKGRISSLEETDDEETVESCS
jgi:hypothetical protein